ncbi:hypothetical protein Purlil1_2122 [Purpureocillium lilacinum]|uniref:Uncharacterized protein n=1 Tax=Purpureocillium lilacinum TaxID=33203 RepID=A0ABR0CD13_PURLI|nr:hypothetical protein Purlil1_2122 [Purpureocillium lilacinum]
MGGQRRSDFRSSTAELSALYNGSVVFTAALHVGMPQGDVRDAAPLCHRDPPVNKLNLSSRHVLEAHVRLGSLYDAAALHSVRHSTAAAAQARQRLGARSCPGAAVQPRRANLDRLAGDDDDDGCVVKGG